MPAQTEKAAVPHRGTQALAMLDFNEIEEPGSYVFVESGNLIRVPPEGLAAGHSPLISITCCDGQQARVARLSRDAAAPISKLRSIAADADIFVNF